MPALVVEYQDILRRELMAHYVSHLPPLIKTNTSAQQQADKQVNRALSAFALHASLNISAAVAAKSVVDDFHDNGIDAIYYDGATERLHLVQSKLKAGEEFQQDDAQAFCAGVRLLLQQNFGAFNENVQAQQIEIETALAAASHIQLWIVYTGTRVSDPAKAALKHLIEDESLGESERMSQDVEYFGPDRIVGELLRRQSYQPVNAEIVLAHDAKIHEPRVTWYGMTAVADLVALHEKYGKALYEKNVRYFLGSGKSDVNKGIQKTLSEDAEAFFYLNNGVTALCSEVAAKDRKAGRRRLKVTGLSIVNGAQTVASAAEAMKQTGAPDISKARVMFTLIRAGADGTFGPRVTRCRNSQNPVSTASFASQDPLQERLRQELRALNIEYHYRPESVAAPSPTSVLLEEALHALAWMSPDPRYPVWLKSRKGDVDNPDSDQYRHIFSEGLHGAHVANAVFISRAVKALLRAADASSVGTERLVYRHGMHAIGWTYLKRLRNRIFTPAPIDSAAIPQLISQAFDEHRQIAANCFLNNGHLKGPLAFFKNQTDSTPYLATIMEKAFGLENHQALPALKQGKANEAFPMEGLMKFLSNGALQV